MCSILGFYQQGPIQAKPDFISVGLRLMRHRGPDAEAFKVYDDRVGLANQRLSIIDVSVKTNQPMENQGSVLVFNGEIYNYLELRNQLKTQGVEIKTDSDTEILQKGIDTAGAPFFNQLNGMFALAYYHRARQQLWLVRDRFGVKPLHYTLQNGVFYFSSEIKPLIHILKNPRRNLALYQHFIEETATDFDEQTFIEGIYQLPPGHWVVADRFGYRVKRWYFGRDFTFNQAVFRNRRQTIELTKDLLTDAIDLRLRADVPVSLTLSGGLDSTTLYVLMKERLKRSATLFTVVNRDSEINELAKVERLVGEYGDQLIKLDSQIKEDAVSDIREALERLEFPSWDPSVVAYLNIYKKIAEAKFKVVIEGHGSDEQLGGYPYLVRAASHEFLRRNRLLYGLSLVKIYQETRAVGENKSQSFLELARHALRSAREPGRPTFNQLLQISFDYKILPIVLRTFDRLTMASSVEGRSPFMDYRVVEFFRQLPLDYKLSTIGSKAILREILKQFGKDYLYRDKRKIGFGVDTVQLINYPKNKQFFRDWVTKFNLPGSENLQRQALGFINAPTIPENGVVPVWKAASLAYLDQLYGLSS